MQFYRGWHCIICFVVLILSAGCIKLDITLTLSKTGAAKVVANYSVSKQTISNMNAMRKVKEKLALFIDRSNDVELSDEFLNIVLNMSESDIKQEFANISKYGVALDYLSVENKGDQRYVRCEFTITNIVSLVNIPFLANCALSLTKDSNGNYILFHPALGKTIDSEPFDAVLANTRVPLLERFRVSICVNTPAPILRTNAYRKSPTSALWVFDSDNNPSAFAVLHRQQFYIQFAGTNLKLSEIKFGQSSSLTID